MARPVGAQAARLHFLCAFDTLQPARLHRAKGTSNGQAARSVRRRRKGDCLARPPCGIPKPAKTRTPSGPIDGYLNVRGCTGSTSWPGPEI